MKFAIELTSVNKLYKDKVALKDVNLTVERGQTITLLGPNGAGKSTLVSLIAGLTQPTNGTVKVFGNDTKLQETKQKIGVMLQEVTMLEKIYVGEVIKLFQSYYKNPLGYKEIMSLSGLHQYERHYASALSGGETRRLQFAIAIAGNPELLILDEPTTGMDIQSRERFWKRLHEFVADGRTLILTTHDLNEAEGITDRLVVLNQGAVVTDGNLEVLKNKLELQNVQFQVRLALDSSDLINLCPDQRYEISEGMYSLWVANSDRCLEHIFTKGLVQKYGIFNIEVQRGGLHDIFKTIIN